MTPTPERIRSLEMVRLTGVTLRQLQWWDEKGILKPRYGTPYGIRLYSREQVEPIIRMVRLRRAGVPLQALREFAKVQYSRIVSTTKAAVLVGDVLVVFRGAPKARAGAERADR